MWVCVCSRTLWVFSLNCPVRLGVSIASSSPTDFFSQRFTCFISPHQSPGLHGLSRSPVVPSGLPTHKCGTARSTSQHLTWSSSCPPSSPAPPLLQIWMNGFFFNSLVVRLPYSSIFCQFWCFLFLNLLLSFFWLCREAQCIYLCLHLGQLYSSV